MSGRKCMHTGHETDVYYDKTLVKKWENDIVTDYKIECGDLANNFNPVWSVDFNDKAVLCSNPTILADKEDENSARIALKDSEAFETEVARTNAQFLRYARVLSEKGGFLVFQPVGLDHVYAAEIRDGK